MLLGNFKQIKFEFDRSSEISELPRGNVGVLCTALCSLHNVLLYFCTCTLVYSHTHSIGPYVIKDTAVRDERGDDVPDNESNEWEVGRELMCSSRGDVFAGA